LKAKLRHVIRRVLAWSDYYRLAHH